MNTTCTLLLIAATLPFSPLRGAGAPPAAGNTVPQGTQKEPDSRQKELLAKAQDIGHAWQQRIKDGLKEGALDQWGYHAFQSWSPELLLKSLRDQSAPLGRLLESSLQEERCLIDLNGGSGDQAGVYITLRWLSRYEKGTVRDYLVLHEPVKSPAGLKIIGFRREPLPAGRQGGFELGAALGQLALLKMHGAPETRWKPYEEEASALAATLKAALPVIPPTASPEDKESGERLVNFVMEDSRPLLKQLGEAGGAEEARAALHAFAMLMLYTPGDETCTQLAVLMGSAAEKGQLPGELWKPVIKAVNGKEALPVVYESVQRMIAGVSVHLGGKQSVTDAETGTKEILDAAFANMASLPTYMARAEMTTPDGRRSVMDAALAPGIMDLTLQGFDGKRERRVVSEKGHFLSRDEGKTWQTAADLETAKGLCRTLQAPVDPTSKVTAKQEFELKGRETYDGEELFRFESIEKSGESPRIYWILMSKAGPVVRRARLLLKFGDLTADTLLIYTQLGKEVEVAEPIVKP